MVTFDSEEEFVMSFQRNYLIKTCLVLFLMLCVGIGLFAYKGPIIKFKEEKWDFGQTKQGKILTHVFKFQNDGDATLIIKNVRTSCGCAAALISKKELRPGEKGEIKVTFNTKGYGGRQSKFVYVESNDPQHPRIQLLILASIDIPPSPKIELDKYSVDLGLILETEPIETTSKITNAGELELQVEFSHKNAVFMHNNKQVSSASKIPAGKSMDITMKITPRKRQGLVREYILLKTNDPMRPNLSLYISGYIITNDQLQELFDRYKDKLKD